MKKLMILVLLVAFHNFSFADDSCEQILKACEKAGFIVGGGAKPSTELWNDCAMPIFQGKKTQHKLPQVKKSTVESCRKANPNFGQKH